MKAACKIAAFFINKYERLRQKKFTGNTKNISYLIILTLSLSSKRGKNH